MSGWEAVSYVSREVQPVVSVSAARQFATALKAEVRAPARGRLSGPVAERNPYGIATDGQPCGGGAPSPPFSFITRVARWKQTTLGEHRGPRKTRQDSSSLGSAARRLTLSRYMARLKPRCRSLALSVMWSVLTVFGVAQVGAVARFE